MSTPSPSILRTLLIDAIGQLLADYGVEGDKRMNWLMNSSRDLTRHECRLSDASRGTALRRVASSMLVDVCPVGGHGVWIHRLALQLLFSSIVYAPRGFHSVVYDLTVGTRRVVDKMQVDALYYTGSSGRMIDTLCCVDPSKALQVCLLRRGIPSCVGFVDHSLPSREYLLTCGWSMNTLETALVASEHMETIADHIAHWFLAGGFARITLLVDGVRITVGEKCQRSYFCFPREAGTGDDLFARLASPTDMHTMRSGFVWQCNRAFRAFSTHPDTAVLPRDIVSHVRQYFFEGAESFTD